MFFWEFLCIILLVLLTCIFLKIGEMAASLIDYKVNNLYEPAKWRGVIITSIAVTIFFYMNTIGARPLPVIPDTKGFILLIILCIFISEGLSFILFYNQPILIKFRRGIISFLFFPYAVLLIYLFIFILKFLSGRDCI